jgi:hypothetical protein
MPKRAHRTGWREIRANMSEPERRERDAAAQEAQDLWRVLRLRTNRPTSALNEDVLWLADISDVRAWIAAARAAA